MTHYADDPLSNLFPLLSIVSLILIFDVIVRLKQYGGLIDMRSLKVKTLLLFLFLLAFQSAFAQEKPTAKLIDSFPYSNSEGASAKIDNFRIWLNNSPTNGGYVIVYGGRIGKKGEVAAHIRGIKQAFYLKKVDLERVPVVNGGYREKLTVEFWVIPEGSVAPPLSPSINAKKVRFKGISKKTIPYECCF